MTSEPSGAGSAASYGPGQTPEPVTAPSGPTNPGGPGGASPGGQPPGDGFDGIRNIGIVRSPDRWVGGVAGGIARRFDVDPLLVRGVVVALSVVGVGVLLYSLAWLLLPEPDGRVHLQRALRGHFSAGFVGSAFFTLVGLLALNGGGRNDWGPPGIGWGFPGVFLTAILLLVIWWAVTRKERPSGPAGPGTPRYGGPAGSGAPGYGTPPPYGYSTPGTAQYATGAPYPSTGTSAYRPGAYGTSYGSSPHGSSYGAGSYGPPAAPPAVPPVPPAAPRPDRTAPSHSLTRLTLGAALLAAAAVVLVGVVRDGGGGYALVAAAAALAVIGIGVVLAGLRGRRSGGLAPIGILLAVIVAMASAATAASDNLDLRLNNHAALTGDRTWHPDNVSEAEDDYLLGMGDARLVLTDADVVSAGTVDDPVHVAVRIGVGDLVVQVPQNVSVDVESEIGDGRLTGVDGISRRLGGSNNDYHGPVTLHSGPAGQPVLTVDVLVGNGDVQIETVPAEGAAASTPTPSTSPAPPATPSSTPATTATPSR